MTINKSTLLEGGYTAEEMDNATPFEELHKSPWSERPNLTIKDGKLHYCNYRCWSSYRGGGNCNCINHPAEEWFEVVD